MDCIYIAPLSIHPFTHTFTHQQRLAAMQGTVAECVFLPSRWRYVVISAYCKPSHFFCDPSHLPVIGKVACGAEQYVGGTSLVLVPINFLLQPFNHVCLVIIIN